MYSRRDSQATGAGLTRNGFIASIQRAFPSLSRSVQQMLALGERGEQGGLVLIDSRDPAEIARIYAEKTGRSTADGQASKSPRIRKTIQELLDGIERMRDWHDWYERHDAVIERLFGDDAKLFQDILSVTSQANTVKGNVTLALQAYQQLKTGQPFTGYMAGVVNNLNRILENQAIQGDKIGEYAKANRGDEQAIAVDRHIAMLFFDTIRPSKAQIAAAKRRIVKLSEMSGLTPKQVQATLWAHNQVLRGTDPTKVQSYDRILIDRADEINALRAAFSGREGGSVSAGSAVLADVPAGLAGLSDRGGRERTGTESEVERILRRISEPAPTPVLPTTLTDHALSPEQRAALAQTEIDVPAIEAETGARLTIKQPAAQALDEANERIDFANRLLQCLKS